MTDWKPPPHTYRQAPEPEKHGQIPLPGIKGHTNLPMHKYVKPGSDLFKQRSNPHVWGTLAGEHNPFLHHEMGDELEYGGHSSEPESVHEWNTYDHEGFDEAKKHLQKLTDKSHPAIRASDDVLHKVLDDGRFKSQFETQTSRGNLNNGMRSNVEARKFGYPDHIQDTSYNDPHDYQDHYDHEDEDHEEPEHHEPRHPDNGRPIYGYLSHEGLKTRIDDNTSHYGEHKVVLHKPSVWHRTTMTMGDSLNNHSRVGPSPVQAVSPYSFHPGTNDTDRDDENPYATEEGDTPDKRIKAIKHFGPSKARSTEHGKHPDGMGHDYVEAQFHGGVTTSDIHYVHLASEYHRGANDGLKKKLDHHGIPWVEATGDGTGQVADQSGKSPKEAMFNRVTLAVESYLRLMERHSMGQVRVVAQQGNDRFLLSETSDPKGMVRVADTAKGTISGEVTLQSMLKQGYWEDPQSGIGAHEILSLVKPA